MKVIICGSSQWSYDAIVRDEIVRLNRESKSRGKKLLVIHGGEPGAETFAGEFCLKQGIDQIIQPAVRVLGDNSYYRRNELMLAYHKPDIVIGFAHDLTMSKVVYDIIKRAELKGIRTKSVDYKSLKKGILD